MTYANVSPSGVSGGSAAPAAWALAAHPRRPENLRRGVEIAGRTAEIPARVLEAAGEIRHRRRVETALARGLPEHDPHARAASRVLQLLQARHGLTRAPRVVDHETRVGTFVTRRARRGERGRDPDAGRQAHGGPCGEVDHVAAP